MWAWTSGRCARYLQPPTRCTHTTSHPECEAPGDHSGWLRNTDHGWRCDHHREETT